MIPLASHNVSLGKSQPALVRAKPRQHACHVVRGQHTGAGRSTRLAAISSIQTSPAAREYKFELSGDEDVALGCCTGPKEKCEAVLRHSVLPPGLERLSITYSLPCDYNYSILGDEVYYDDEGEEVPALPAPSDFFDFPELKVLTVREQGPDCTFGSWAPWTSWDCFNKLTSLEELDFEG
jgi:hypothetical protein